MKGVVVLVFLLLLLHPIEGGGGSSLWSVFAESQKKVREVNEGGEERIQGVEGGRGKKYSDFYSVYWKDPVGCQPHPPIDRYLLMSKRNGGWSNERLIIESAIVMAWAMNRTLVIPHRMRLDHMHGNETFERFLDLSYARCHVPIILSTELPRLSGGIIDPYFKGVENSPETLTADIQYNNGAFAIPRAPSFRAGDTYEELVEFERFRAGRKFVFQLSPDDQGYQEALAVGGNKDEMSFAVVDNSYRFLNSKNHFYMYYYAYYWFKDKAKHNVMIDLVKNGAHYADYFWDASLPVLQELGEPAAFSTIHIRSRDFRKDKGFYQYFKKKSWLENFQEHHKNTFLPGETVYISTDEKNITEIKEFQKQLDQELHIKSYTIYDFFDKLNIDENLASRRWEFWGDRKVELEVANKFNLNDLALIEQIICAHGRRYVATYFSTYSAYISRIRGYLHRDYAPWNNIKVDEHLFWDRTLEGGKQCTFGSKPETCIPSWTGKFRGAIWASEFEEGWNTYEQVTAHQKAREISLPSSFPRPKHFSLLSPSVERLFKGEGRRERGERERRGRGEAEESGGGAEEGEKGWKERGDFLAALKKKQGGAGIVRKEELVKKEEGGEKGEGKGKLRELFEKRRRDRVERMMVPN